MGDQNQSSRDNAPVKKVAERKVFYEHIAGVREDPEFQWSKQPFHSQREVSAADPIPAGCS